MNAPRVSAAPSRGRLRELAAAGYPLAYLAVELGTTGETLSAIRRGQRQHIAPGISQGIAYAHRRLIRTAPAAHGIPAASITRSRLNAVDHGWARGVAT